MKCFDQTVYFQNFTYFQVKQDIQWEKCSKALDEKLIGLWKEGTIYWIGVKFKGTDWKHKKCSVVKEKLVFLCFFKDCKGKL